MNECERLAHELEKALNGNAWHGPSMREALAGVGRGAALAHPIPGAHSIAEIVLHMTTWNGVVRSRIDVGVAAQVSDEQDWPKAELATDAAWDAVRETLEAGGRDLVAAMGAFPAEKLHDPRPGLTDSWYVLFSGAIQHVIYHAGQIALLRKAG